ncbi:MAG: DUF2726 domain-containing protein [Bacilli bacterium]
MKNLIYKILKYFGLLQEEKEERRKDTIYIQKPIMTEYEYRFYQILKELENKYIIIPQLNLAAVIKKVNNNRYYNELFRNIDFAIFSKDYKKLLLLIEINDQTHDRYKRQDRDLKVKKICNDVNAKLISFYTKYPNEKNYVINRIEKEIDLNNN